MFPHAISTTLSISILVGSSFLAVSPTRRSIPVKVRRLSGIKEISAGRHSSLALDIDGNVWAWGLNTSGQLGIGTKVNSLYPTNLSTVKDIVQISTGLDYSVLVTTSGEVYSFGINGSGQLGDGTTINKNIPTQVVMNDGSKLGNIEYVSCGSKHVIAKTNDGKVFAWGSDNNYQFGDEDTSNKLNPVQVKYSKTADLFEDVLEVSAGDTHSVIVKDDGTVWEAGKNNYGQIGDGTTSNRKEWVCISNIKIKVPENEITIHKIGGTYELKPELSVGFNLLYDSMSNGQYSYESKNENIAKVDRLGNITGVKRGKTKIGITEVNTNKTIYVDVYVLEENDIAFPQVVTTEYSTIALKSDGSILINHGKSDFIVEQGEKIAQLVLNEVKQIGWKIVDSLNETDREGGFGHSDKEGEASKK